MKHATVEIAGMTIPLIGIPPVATADKCDSCQKPFHIQDLCLCGTRFLCEKCKRKQQTER